MSQNPEHVTPTWLVVLPAQISEGDLTRLHSEVQGRGWSAGSSRGEEQVILAVQGPHDPEEIRSVLAGRFEMDIIPVLEGERYKLQRARRHFQSTLVTGLGLLVLVGLVVPLVGFLEPPPGTIFSPDLVRVARVDEVAVGERLLVRLSEKPVFVLRLAPERWHAVSASCTFMDDCLLEWDAERRQLLCPCHGCAFDVHGNVVHPPASLPLVRLEVVQSVDGLFVRRTL
ncbi:MAG: Rieske (2Fe-2S) protein [Planctomycetes bacterium]|nr:Rieske (2Fe-2S) protein [Planctomycetota bacterium]